MEPKLLAVVALLVNIPERGLARDQEGTLVEKLDDGFFEVEFCDNGGQTIATIALHPSQFRVLRHNPAIVA